MLKRINLTGTALILLLTTQLAVAENSKSERYSIGVTSSEVSNDEAGAISIGTPLYNDLFQVKFSLVQAYKDGIKDGDTSNAWYGYQIYNLGVAFNLREVPGLMRVYADVGINYIKTSASLSSASAKVGRYGLVGAELYLDPNSWLNCCSAYVEFGSTGKGVKANNIIGDPTIGHGFVSTVGLRYYF